MESNHSLKLILQRYGVEKNTYHSLTTQINTGVNSEFIATLVKLFDDHRIITAAEFSGFNSEVIVDYIRKTHRFYLTKKLPEIEQSIELLFNCYEETHPLLLMLKNFFSKYQQDLNAHILIEENLLLPYIDYLLSLKNMEMHIGEYFYRTIKYSVSQFVKEHDDTEDELQKVYSAILCYDPPKTNATPYRILLAQLHLLEKDLNMHAFIENHVLLPRALEMENQFSKEFRKRVEMN